MQASETHASSITSDPDEIAADFASAPSETSALTPQTNHDHGTAGVPALAGAVSVSPFAIEPAGIFDAPALHFNPDWHSSGHSSINTRDGSVGMATHPSLNPFDFQHSYGHEPQGHPSDDQPMLFGNSFLDSPITAPPLGIPYVWDVMSTANLPAGVAGLQHFGADGLADSSTRVAAATGQDFLGPGQSGGSYPEQQSSGASAYSVESNIGQSGSSSVHSDVKRPGDGQHSKRAKTTSRRALSKSPMNTAAALPSPPTIAGSSKGNTRSTGSSKSRPSSRSLKKAAKAAKTIGQAPEIAEAAEDGRMRSSHNVVEKQYRNRLNAQFEGLMSALPENLKAQGVPGAENADTLNSDVAERRISKAEVLDMARRHIQTLEQERDLLAHERARLQETVEKLKDDYARGKHSRGNAEDN